MNSEMMAKLRGLIVEAATGECNITAEGKSCPVHGMEECAGYMEESNDIKPAGISDELAAKKIAAKIMGTPDLNIPKIKQYVTKYLSMVGKAPTDVTHLAALVHTELENKGVMESSSKPDFPDLDGDGNRTEPMKDAAKDAKSGKKPAAKKGGMSAKQAKYFGKKAAVKEATALSPELQALMQKYGVDESFHSAGSSETVLPEDEASDQQALAKLIQDIRNGPAPDPTAVMARMRELFGVDERPAPTRPAPSPGTLRHYLDNPDVDATGTEHADMLRLMQDLGLREDEESNYKDEMQFGKKSSKQSGPWRWKKDPKDDPQNSDHYIPVGSGHRRKYDQDDYDYGMNSSRGRDRDIDFNEDMHITVDGQEAQDMIGRLMSLAGQDMPAHNDHADHADMCDGCGCASADCNCDSDIATGYSGPVDLSMEENIDNDFGHTAQSDMGEPVDPDTYMYKAPVGNQRFVKMGDNPLIKENAAALSSKLKKDYRRYVAEAELARSNAGDASPLTADNRDDFDMDPFAGDAPVTDGSRSPLSTVKRQSINK
jgi:hypothetical protein